MAYRLLHAAQLAFTVLVLSGCGGGSSASKIADEQGKVDQAIFADPSTGGPDSKQAAQPQP
jgi:predicted component of type VI protein secretion system